MSDRNVSVCKVKHIESGTIMVINESDFDEAQHEKVTKKAAKPAPAPIKTEDEEEDDPKPAKKPRAVL